MPDNHHHHIGVDIAKQNFVADLPKGVTNFKQTACGMRHFLEQLPEKAWVVCEASGGYEKALVSACHKAGLRVSVANPMRVRAFAASQGILAKTDRIDAPLISLYARKTESLREHRQPSEAEQELRALYQHRAWLVDMLKQEQNLAEHAPDKSSAAGKLLAKMSARRMRQLERQIKQLEEQMRRHIDADQRLRQRAERMKQVKAVGELSIAAVLCLMPELGELEKGQAGALLGAAPIVRQSGDTDKARHIQGGRHRLRKAIYMAALSAAQHNGVLKVFYQRLRTQGKPVKVALTALMRKIIEVLNALIKNPNLCLAQ
jgi:transposase